MPRSNGYVSPDYLKKAAERVRQIKERTYDLMEIQAGDKVLDMGCGPGMDTVPLAKRVTEAGSVVGIDVDEEMLRLADEYAATEGVKDRTLHQRGDILNLPFKAGEFTACRAERLLQVLPPSIDQGKVVVEMLRVIRPGGKIVLADTDWATASVDFPDEELERRLLAFFAQKMRPNGFAGRQLHRRLQESGATDIRIEIFPLLHQDYSQTPFGDWLVNDALAAQIASPAEMERWKSVLTDLSATGRFYCTVNVVVESGRKPG